MVFNKCIVIEQEMTDKEGADSQDVSSRASSSQQPTDIVVSTSISEEQGRARTTFTEC